MTPKQVTLFPKATRNIRNHWRTSQASQSLTNDRKMVNLDASNPTNTKHRVDFYLDIAGNVFRVLLRVDCHQDCAVVPRSTSTVSVDLMDICDSTNSIISEGTKQTGYSLHRVSEAKRAAECAMSHKPRVAWFHLLGRCLDSADNTKTVQQVSCGNTGRKCTAPGHRHLCVEMATDNVPEHDAVSRTSQSTGACAECPKPHTAVCCGNPGEFNQAQLKSKNGVVDCVVVIRFSTSHAQMVLVSCDVQKPVPGPLPAAKCAQIWES